ncbi:MAG: hypothetical protein ACXVH3_16635 [Solirubrobacteraceae bacterium]
MATLIKTADGDALVVDEPLTQVLERISDAINIHTYNAGPEGKPLPDRFFQVRTQDGLDRLVNVDQVCQVTST